MTWRSIQCRVAEKKPWRCFRSWDWGSQKVGIPWVLWNSSQEFKCFWIQHELNMETSWTFKTCMVSKRMKSSVFFHGGLIVVALIDSFLCLYKKSSHLQKAYGFLPSTIMKDSPISSPLWYPCTDAKTLQSWWHGFGSLTVLQRFPNCAVSTSTESLIYKACICHHFMISDGDTQQCNCWSLKQELLGTRAARATSHAQEIFEWNQGGIQTFDDSMSNGAWHHESCKSPKAYCRWIGCWMFDHHSVATLENACLCEAWLEIQQILVGVVWTFGWAWDDFPYCEILKYYCHDRAIGSWSSKFFFYIALSLFLYQGRKPAPFITLSHLHPPSRCYEAIFLGHWNMFHLDTFDDFECPALVSSILHPQSESVAVPQISRKSHSAPERAIGTVRRCSILNHEEIGCTGSIELIHVYTGIAKMLKWETVYCILCDIVWHKDQS